MRELHGIVHDLVTRLIEVGGILWSWIDQTGSRSIPAFIGKEFVCDAHFHVVGFAGKHFERFILRLPTKTRDGSVVAAGIRVAGNSQMLFERRVRLHVRKDRGIGDVFDQSGAEYRRRNAEDQIAELLHLIEIRLSKIAGSRVRAASNGEQTVDTSIGSSTERTVGIDGEREAGFPHRTV